VHRLQLHGMNKVTIGGCRRLQRALGQRPFLMTTTDFGFHDRLAASSLPFLESPPPLRLPSLCCLFPILSLQLIAHQTAVASSIFTSNRPTVPHYVCCCAVFVARNQSAAASRCTLTPISPSPRPFGGGRSENTAIILEAKSPWMLVATHTDSTVQ
jgi:hypothetical protein